ncbi:hypothetical protein RI844_06615 [Thalassotalea fonticola]|uniref:Uncharacterized protein n=1 Tax=Thalassotalea fonticola TaxID=3065649 RepID=A0ABZ0GU42_9GAMM|nr:hypothetical protein RI844_06615 [Colwelliaceae bacterium S1-1]
MSNTIKFNKSLIATMVATSMLTACGGDDVKVQDTVTEVVEVPVNVPVATPADPVEVTASAHGSIIDGSSMAPLVGATVEIHSAGEVFSATVTGSRFTVEGLPTNSDFIAVVSAAGKATAYATGTTSDGAINVDTVELFNTITSSVTVTDMMGDNVSGLSLYIASVGDTGSNSSGQADDAAEYLSSIPNNFATETDGVYTFTLPANGMSYDVEVAGDFSGLAVVGGSLAVTSGQNPTVYVDDADEATTFSVSFGLTFADGSAVTSGPETLSLNDGDVTASWDADSAEYVIEGLSFDDIMSPLALDMVEIDGVMFAATDVAAAGLDSFSDAAASSSIALAMNTESDNGEVLPIEYVVAHSAATSATSATMTVVFNQPVELVGDIEAETDLSVENHWDAGLSTYNYFKWKDADGVECTTCSSIKTLQNQNYAYMRFNDIVLEDETPFRQAYLRYLKDTAVDSSDYSYVLAEPDSFFGYFGYSKKAFVGAFGISTELSTKGKIKSLMADGAGAEFSWNEAKTVLTISLNADVYDVDAEVPVLPTGFTEVSELGNAYFNATDIQAGKSIDLALLVKPVSGQAVASDLELSIDVPAMAMEKTTADNLVLSAAIGASVADSEVTGYNGLGGFNVTWSSYEGQANWETEEFNNIDMEGASSFAPATPDYIRIFWGDKFPVDYIYPEMQNQWCNADVEYTFPDRDITFSWDDNSCTVGSPEALYFPYVKLASVPSSNADVVSKLHENTDGKIATVYLVSKEQLHGNVEIVSAMDNFMGTDEDGLPGAITESVEVNEIVGLSLDGEQSYNTYSGTQYYIANTWENAYFKKKYETNAEGTTFGAPIVTGFPASVEGMHYVYPITMNANRLGNAKGMIKEMTLNLNLTTESGEVISVQNKVMSVQ